MSLGNSKHTFEDHSDTDDWVGFDEEEISSPLKVNTVSATTLKGAIPRKSFSSTFPEGKVIRLRESPAHPDLDDWSEEFPLDIGIPEHSQNLQVMGQGAFRYNCERVATIRARKYDSNFTSDDSIIKGTFFDPPSGTISPTQRSLKRKIEDLPKFEEDCFEDGFEMDIFCQVDAEKLLKFQTKQNGPAEETLDKILGEETMCTSAAEHSKQVISSSMLSGCTNIEIDLDSDLLDGLVLPDTAIDFRMSLKRQREKFSEKAQLEIQTLRRESKETKKIMKSHFDLSSTKDGADEVDFLDGFELEKGDILQIGSKNMLHHNVKFQRRKNSRNQLSSLPSKFIKNIGSKSTRDTASRRTSTNSIIESPGIIQPVSSVRTLGLSVKKSMPLLRRNNIVTTLAFSGSSNGKIRRLSKTSATSEEKTQEGLFQGLASTEPLNGSPKKRTKIESLNMQSAQSFTNIEDTEKKSTRWELPFQPEWSGSNDCKKKVIGDGTELDFLEDSPTKKLQAPSSMIQPTRKREKEKVQKNLESYKEKAASSTAKDRNSEAYQDFKSRSKDRRRKAERKLGLIQQFGPPVATNVKGYNGNMQFNLETCKWVGNNEDLKRFDNTNSKTPGLIAYISSKDIQIVGDMVFDPVKMKWINLNQEAANEDPFQESDELEVVNTKTAHSMYHCPVNASENSYSYQNQNQKEILSGNIQPRRQLSTRTNADRTAGSASMHESYLDNNDRYVVGNEFELLTDSVRRFRHEESRWEQKVQGWFPPNETFNRAYLDEIWNMVIKNT